MISRRSIVMLIAFLSTTLCLAAPGSTEDARKAFDRLKRLEGDWHARSSKGWSETISYEVVARGSVVVSRTDFADSPESRMYTMFHLDGPRLMLTHYCEARNQPRLVATSIEDEGRTITFTFLDATGIRTRDEGHMDKAVYRFGDDDSFSSRWTWYKDGEESWMEEIMFERVR